MTALLFELERITPMRVTTPVMHATMIDSIKELPPELVFRPQEAVSICVTHTFIVLSIGNTSPAPG
jgi:hypothetical protein